MKTSIKLILFSLLTFTLASCQGYVENMIKKRMTENQEEQAALLASEKMHVFLLGTGGPIANETRDTSGVAIIAGGEFIIVDAGPGIVRNMGLLNLPNGRLSAVFLTHFHSDHISDLGELSFNSFVGGRAQKLDVYGPEGVEQVVNGYNMAYALDSGYRTAHHSKELMPPENSGMIPHTFTITDPEQAVPFFDRNGLKASVFQVDHSPVKPAVGYRFEYRGNVVVISGDTVKTATLPKFAENADLFLCEALRKDGAMLISRIAGEMGNHRVEKILEDVTNYHMSPIEAGEVAREAGVKKLVLVHVVPPVENFVVRRMFLEGVEDVFDGEIILGEDRMTFELPPKE